MNNGRIAMLWLVVEEIHAHLYVKNDLIQRYKNTDTCHQGIETLINEIKELTMIKAELMALIEKE